MVIRAWLAAMIVLMMGLGLRVAPAAGAPLHDAQTVLVAVDNPAAGSNVGGSVVLRGWAADPASPRGTGVDRVDVYLNGEAGDGGTYLGAADYGLPRPDVARHLGAPRFGASGFALPLALPPGPHTLYVYAHASEGTADTGWSTPTTLALLVGAGSPRTPSPALPPPLCRGIPAPYGGGPFGAYPLETPQSYGAIYPTDVPFVFGNPAFWLTYGNPGAPAYIDFREGTVLPNSYFYQPRPARGIPVAC